MDMSYKHSGIPICDGKNHDKDAKPHVAIKMIPFVN